jgi:hypothetical protein
MLRNGLGLSLILAFALPAARAADVAAAPAKLSAAAIVDKNVAARGGLEAWRAVQTLSMEGKMGAGGNRRETLALPNPDKKAGKLDVPSRPAGEALLPFVMELGRPRKMRLELQFAGQTAIQVYDGANGWKLRPYLNRLEVEPYTAEEAKSAAREQDLDGPLVDYAAKGTRIELVGTEKVEDHDTYKLRLAMKNGQKIHVWIDAQTFLEAKIEAQPRRMDGVYHPVEVYYRDYRAVNGLRIPFVLETRVLPVAKNALGVRDTPVPPEKIILEKITVNPTLAASAFVKPHVKPAASAPGTH